MNAMNGDQPRPGGDQKCHRIELTNAWEPWPEEPRAVGVTCWMRRFGRPTGLGADDRVWLVIERPRVRSLTLNGLPLPVAAAGAAAWRGEVTALLRVRNVLTLVPEEAMNVAATGAAGRGHGRRRLPDACGCVRLEIEPAS